MISSNEARLEVRVVGIEEVKELIKNGYISCIGHQSTADVLSELLERKIETNRVSITLKKDDILIVFQLLERIPEGKVLTREEILKISYKFYTLKIIEEGGNENYSFEL